MECSTPDFLSFTISQSLLMLMSVELMMPSNHLIFCHFLLLPPTINPSIRFFSNDSALQIRWPKYWPASASPSVLPLNIQDWFSLGWACWISLLSKGLFFCYCCCWTVLILLMGICVYSVTLFIVVINLYLYIGLLQFWGVSFFFSFLFLKLFKPIIIFPTFIPLLAFPIVFSSCS